MKAQDVADKGALVRPASLALVDQAEPLLDERLELPTAVGPPMVKEPRR